MQVQIAFQPVCASFTKFTENLQTWWVKDVIDS